MLKRVFVVVITGFNLAGLLVGNSFTSLRLLHYCWFFIPESPSTLEMLDQYLYNYYITFTLQASQTEIGLIDKTSDEYTADDKKLKLSSFQSVDPGINIRYVSVLLFRVVEEKKTTTKNAELC